MAFMKCKWLDSSTKRICFIFSLCVDEYKYTSCCVYNGLDSLKGSGVMTNSFWKKISTRAENWIRKIKKFFVQSIWNWSLIMFKLKQQIFGMNFLSRNSKLKENWTILYYNKFYSISLKNEFNDSITVYYSKKKAKFVHIKNVVK